jgi:hypothetical protein
MFVGIIIGKPSGVFTRPLGMPSGLKGLLHMLNAIISPTTADLCFESCCCPVVAKTREFLPPIKN